MYAGALIMIYTSSTYGADGNRSGSRCYRWITMNARDVKRNIDTQQLRQFTM